MTSLRGRGASLAAAAVLLWAAAMGLSAEPASTGGESAGGDLPYTLGPETVPNGSFDRVGPKWQQLRPDEGEKIAVIPEGWLAGYQGGLRQMPIPGVDPETHDRCMVFLYGAGQVDIFAPAFPLSGPGTYLLSIRTRSVVNPTDRALRVVLRLLPLPDSPPEQREVVLERTVGAGPPERLWRKWTFLLEVPRGLSSAELHLIKEDPPADFLVDDLSLRRIEAVASETRIEVPSAGDLRLSPIAYLGALESAAVEVAGIDRSVIVETRTGATAEPGPAWEGWRRGEIQPAAAGLAKGTLHLFGQGIPLYAQVRLRSSGPGAPRAKDAAAPPGRAGVVTLRSLSVSKTVAAREVAFTALPADFEGGEEGWRSLRIPDAAACTAGPLARLRALALKATGGIEGDVARALALRDALRSWAPFPSGGKPPGGGGEPTPEEVLSDCRRSTPLFCSAWRTDLLTAACWCAGLVCRAVSSGAAGDAAAGIEGIEVWDGDAGRWAFLPLPADSASGGIQEDAVGSGSPTLADGGRTDRRWSAFSVAADRPLAFAADLRWGRRGWLVHVPPGGRAVDPPPAGRIARSREEIEFPVGSVHADLKAAGGRTFEVRLTHSMPGFSHYIYRFSSHFPWKRLAEPFLWTLAPGENVAEIRAVNAMGARGPVAALRARVDPEPAERFAAYAGMRALSGDPHVHTGLGIYRILDPKRPLATGTPEGAFASALRNGLDWAAVTDYAMNIDDPRTLEWRRGKKGEKLRNPDGTETLSEWEHLKAVVHASDRPGAFAAFLGVEFDGEGFTTKGGTGRKIILLPDESAATYCSPQVQNVGDCPVVEDAYRYTRQHGGVMIAVTPCAAAGGEDTDWSRHDPAVALMEISRGLCERAPGGLLDVVVRRGLSVGAAGGSHNRSGIAGEADRTICWAPEVNRPAILEAIRARRCYWSAAGHLDLAFTLNGAPIGSEIPAGTATAWSVRAEGRDGPAFASVDVLRNGDVVASAPCESATRCVLEGGIGEGWPGAYYAAVNDAEGARLAVTSPIRVVTEKLP